MFGSYAQVLRRPGALRFTAAGFLARMQMSMMGLGAVMLLSAERGSYAVAGAVAAIYAVSNAIIGPQVSRLIDSFGQFKVVPIQLAIHVPAVIGMIAITLWTPLTWPIYVLALVAGASQPIMGPLVRARWSAQLHGSPLLRTAFAWESLIDEAVFILGPPLATIVALQINPSAGLLLATAMLLVGTVLLLSQRRTEPTPSGRHSATKGRPAILLPGVAAIAAVFVMMGALFGSFEVTTVAFAKASGVPEAAGVVLALYAVGSLLAGLVFGALTLRASLLRQFVLATATLAVVTAPLPFLPQVWQIAVGLFVAGLACSPVLISGMAFVERVVPGARLTESMAWVTSGVAVGIAVASPLAGVIIDRFGAHTAYWVTSGAAILAIVVALAFLPSLRRAQAGAVAPAERVLAAGAPAPQIST
ncbi:MFS transporter [Nakamurella multipartita]|uniref:Major facilitator superfamily MFS_1 n=1 Tax=Nakamurella multipartita (strain ATCC 700099 / DSM 44233 / CIP 104796 / JCM 9543 / NBRC 105858 / Y-104) TaxID=479431 RepID=C8X8C4_NAKMY|nr:MFS transporter [Nakamurella multipartita]ACV77100.1 major facilitator superfamily MFS_1 [Nakamurella multipartita DSM 44233]HOZ57168.1 MFS transporter [Nakamurella multipartita]